MQAAFHHGADLAGDGKLDGEGCGRMAVFGVEDIEAVDRYAGLFGGLADLGLGTDQDRVEQALVADLHGRLD